MPNILEAVGVLRKLLPGGAKVAKGAEEVGAVQKELKTLPKVNLARTPKGGDYFSSVKRFYPSFSFEGVAKENLDKYFSGQLTYSQWNEDVTQRLAEQLEKSKPAFQSGGLDSRRAIDELLPIYEEEKGLRVAAHDIRNGGFGSYKNFSPVIEGNRTMFDAGKISAKEWVGDVDDRIIKYVNGDEKVDLNKLAILYEEREEALSLLNTRK